MCTNSRSLVGRLLAMAALLIVLLATHATARADSIRRMSLRVGEQLSIPATEIVKYSEGSSGIVEVRLPDDGTEFIVVGKRAGESTLLLIREDGQKIRYHFEVRERSSAVREKPNIRLDLYFVELRSSDAQQIGVSWPGSIGVQAELELQLSTVGSGAATATLSSLPLPRLDALQREDWARIVQQATLIACNGEEARLDSGGVRHVEVSGSLAAELREIPFGTRLVVLPRFDEKSGRLELRVDAEVSSLSEGRIPTRSRSALSTIVNVEMNQALVLGGIRSHSRARSSSGLPWVSQIPILGHFFASKGRRSEDRQHLLFIVPSVLDPVSMRSRRLLLETLDEGQRFEGELPAWRLAPSTHAAPREGAR